MKEYLCPACIIFKAEIAADAEKAAARAHAPEPTHKSTKRQSLGASVADAPAPTAVPEPRLPTPPPAPPPLKYVPEPPMIPNIPLAPPTTEAPHAGRRLLPPGQLEVVVSPRMRKVSTRMQEEGEAEGGNEMVAHHYHPHPPSIQTAPSPTTLFVPGTPPSSTSAISTLTPLLPTLTPTATTPQSLDKVRRAARAGFAKTFDAIFLEAVENPDPAVPVADGIDLKDPEAFADALEEELFAATAQKNGGEEVVAGAQYKSKFRTLQFNLNDKTNLRLRTRVLTGAVTLAALVRLPPEDLGNDDVRRAVEEVRRQSMYNAVKPKEEVGYIKKTHKGEVEVEAFNPRLDIVAD
ncbi:transcription factor S-II, central domain-containing protein, partial [Blyttiomyces helicus]